MFKCLQEIPGGGEAGICSLLLIRFGLISALTYIEKTGFRQKINDSAIAINIHSY